MRQLKTRRTPLVLLVLLVLTAGLRLQTSISAASTTSPEAVVYFPVIQVQPSVPLIDLRITHVGLFQSVQNANNGVSLVAGKPAFLRVYAQSSGANPFEISARVTVQAYRNDALLGTLTSELQPVSKDPSADRLDSTYNFDLPADWLHGRIELFTTIDQANSIVEQNEANNRTEHSFVFRKVEPLNLTIVPIIYNDTRLGITYESAPHDPISAWLRTTYPLDTIDVEFHTPFTFSGDLSQPADWQRLLDGLTAIWAVEAGYGSPELYFGLIPTEGPGDSWFQGGISGLGWLGQRVSVGVDFGADTAMLAAHEIGHNFGRRHAPCGNPSNVDPHFPYPDGSIGVYGVDTEEATLHDPHETRDFMSYCGPEWVSDYTYEALFQDQLNRSSQTSVAGSSYLLRAHLADGALDLLPVYQFSGQLFETEVTGDYQVEILDENGAVLGSHPASLLEAQENGVAATMLIAQIPAAPVQASSIRLVKAGETLAIRAMGTSARSNNRLRVDMKESEDRLSIRWNQAEVPAMVRFQPAGASFWTVLAIDQSGGQIEIDLDQLTSRAGRFEITLADGFGQTQIDWK